MLDGSASPLSLQGWSARSSVASGWTEPKHTSESTPGTQVSSRGAVVDCRNTQSDTQSTFLKRVFIDNQTIVSPFSFLLFSDFFSCYFVLICCVDLLC